MNGVPKRWVSHGLKELNSGLHPNNRIVVFKETQNNPRRQDYTVSSIKWIKSSHYLMDGRRANGIRVVNTERRRLYSMKDKDTPDSKEVEKKANLGSMIEQLRELVPQILSNSLPKSIVSKKVLLRICPTHFEEFNAYIPTLRGHVSYYATCKTLQLLLTSIVLNPKVKLHIQSIRATKSNDFKSVIQDSTKIHIRWTTCSEGCSHLSSDSNNDTQKDNLSYHSTSDAKLGSHSWSKLDTSKIIKESKNDSRSNSLPSISTTISSLTTTLIGLTKEKGKLERVISGIFIFELNEDNDQILVHTIEDIDIVERNETEDVDGELRIC